VINATILIIARHRATASQKAPCLAEMSNPRRKSATSRTCLAFCSCVMRNHADTRGDIHLL
jgi:hypothetical protein